MSTPADFYPLILTDVPGCPQPLVDQMVINTAVDFCTRTRIWQAWNEPVAVAGTVSRYSLDQQSGGRIQAILEAKLDGENLTSANFSQLSQWNQNWRNETGKPQFYYLDDDENEIVLVPTPIATGALEALVSHVPPFTAARVPTVLYRRFAEGIAAGAKARLQAMPGVEWANPATAQYNISLYEDAVRSALAFATKSGTGMPLRARAWA
jgi:hypothetical protein